MISPQSRVLITGADGFVGWHVLKHLQEQGWSDVHVTTFSQSERLVAACGADHVHAIDLTDSKAVQNLLSEVQPDAVLHFAAWAAVNGSFEHASKIMTLNTALQLNMLEAIRDQVPQARLLVIGSAHCYGQISDQFDPWHIPESAPFNPDNPYAVSKLTQEMLSRAYATAYNLDCVFVRPFNQIGPGQKGDFAVPNFAHQIVSQADSSPATLLVGNLEAVRDFTDVRDAAVAYRLLLELGESGETYNLGSGSGVPMQEIVDTLIDESGQNVTIETDPKRIRPSDIPVFVADASRLLALGWAPSYSLAETLRDILKEAREEVSENKKK